MRNYTDPVYRPTVTIANGASSSSSIVNTSVGARGIAVIVPAVWTGANLGLEISLDNGTTWVPVRNEEGKVVRITNIKTAEASLYVYPAASWQVGVAPLIRLTSLDTGAADTDFTAQNQGAARTLTVLLLS